MLGRNVGVTDRKEPDMIVTDLSNKEKRKEYNRKWYLNNEQYNKQYNLEHKEHLIQYRLDNKEREKEYNKQYNLEHKEQAKQYNLDHKEQKKEYNKQYNLDNKEKIKEQTKQYRLGHKEKIRERSKQYSLGHKENRNQHQRERRKNDPNFKLAMNLRSRMRIAMKGISKCASTMELLGCTREEFWTHLEKSFYDCKITGEKMTRFNHGKWHFDHIIACAKFNLIYPEQQRICFNWKNYQPLWALDNMIKGAR